MSTRLVAGRQEGSALLIAILLATILSVLAIAAFMSSFTEGIVAVHHAARVEALATAEGSVELLTPWLAYDFENDPQGWSNAVFLVPEPEGNTHPRGLQQDTDGSATGVLDAWYFDLRDVDGDGNSDQTVPALDAYPLPVALAEKMIDPQLFPDAVVRISLRNLTANSAPGGSTPISYMDRAVVLRIEGESSQQVGGMLDNDARAIVDGVEITFGARIDSFWRNAIHGIAKDGLALDTVTVHGSVHAISSENLPDSKGKVPTTFKMALELKNGSSILNHYTGLASELANVLSPPRSGSLDAEVRAYGSIKISSATSSVGQAADAAPSGTKGPIDSAYTVGGFTGTYASRHWEDDLEDYTDAPPDMLHVSGDEYTDPASGIEYDDYFDFLRGSTAGPGANALDLSFFDKHGGKNGNVSFSRASLTFEPEESVAYDLFNRFYSFQNFAFRNAPAGTTLDVFIELEDGSSTLRSYSSALGWSKKKKGDKDAPSACAPGYVDVFSTDDDKSSDDDRKYDGTEGCPQVTGVFGAVKTIPVASSGYPLPLGAVHGLVFIPQDTAVSATSAAILQELLDKISAGLSTPLPSPVNAGTGEIDAVPYGRLYGSGLFMAHRIYLTRDRDDTKSDSYSPLRYAGSMTFFTVHDLEMTGEVLPMRRFACPDALGVVAVKKVVVKKDVAARVAAAFYGKEIQIDDGTHFAGTLASHEKYGIGKNVHVAAADDLPECVPPFLPDEPQFRMELRGWNSSR